MECSRPYPLVDPLDGDDEDGYPVLDDDDDADIILGEQSEPPEDK